MKGRETLTGFAIQFLKETGHILDYLSSEYLLLPHPFFSLEIGLIIINDDSKDIEPAG